MDGLKPDPFKKRVQLIHCRYFSVLFFSRGFQALPVVVNHIPEQLRFTPAGKGIVTAAAVLVAAGCFAASLSIAQARQRTFNGRRPVPAADAGESPDQVELNRRIQAADAAQKSGNPAAIERENKRLIAEGLRLMGKLRLAESAFPQSAQLFRTSLELENAPGLYDDLAIALQLAGQQDEAISEAQKALTETPNDAKAYITMGRAYLAKGDFDRAAAAFAHATRIHPDVDVLYSQAQSWLSSKDPDGRKRADAVFAEMRAMAGDSGSLHVLMGRAYRDAGLMPDAIREFQRAIAINTRTPHAHYFLGLAYLAQNEWQPTPKAQEEMEKELQYHPNDFLANYMLGFVESSERQYAIADKYLKKASTLNPAWPEPFLYMGLDAFAQGDNATAKAMLLKAVKLTGTDESRANYEIRRAYVDLARIYSREGNEKDTDVYVAKARNLENKVMQESQQRTTALMLAEGGKTGAMAAVVPLAQRENHPAPLADASADAATRLDAAAMAKSNLTADQLKMASTEEDALRPILGQSYSDLATAEAIEHNYTDAVAHYEAAEQWDPKIPGLEKNLGQAAFRAGNYEEAVHGLSAAVKENPNVPALRAMLGMSYFNLKRYGDAATAFYPLGEAAMRDPVVGYAWAASLAGTGDLKDASQVLNIWQQQRLPNEELILAAQLWNKIGNYDRAISTVRQILASDPKFPRAHFVIAQADIGAWRWEDAAAELNEELAVSPDDTDARYDLGFVDVQESKDGEAMKLFQQVIAAHPDYGNAQYQVGKMLMDSGKPQQALPYLEAAARLDPNKAYVHYQLQAAYRRLSRTADANRELAIYEKITAASRARLQHDIEEMQQKH